MIEANDSPTLACNQRFQLSRIGRDTRTFTTYHAHTLTPDPLFLILSNPNEIGTHEQQESAELSCQQHCLDLLQNFQIKSSGGSSAWQLFAWLRFYFESKLLSSKGWIAVKSMWHIAVMPRRYSCTFLKNPIFLLQKQFLSSWLCPVLSQPSYLILRNRNWSSTWGEETRSIWKILVLSCQPNSKLTILVVIHGSRSL